MNTPRLPRNTYAERILNPASPQKPNQPTPFQPIISSIKSGMAQIVCDLLSWSSVGLGKSDTGVKSDKSAGRAGTNLSQQDADQKVRAAAALQHTYDCGPDACTTMPDYSGPSAQTPEPRNSPSFREAQPMVNVNGNEDVLRTEAKNTDVFVSDLMKDSQRTKDELQVAYIRIENLQADLAVAKERESSKHVRLLQAENDNKHLERCLEDCKHRIFEMQPIEHMTDAQIAEQYVALCEAISDWTDQQFGEVDNPLEATEEVAQQGTARRLIEKCLVRTGGLDIARTHPSSGCIILTSFIHMFLHRAILHEKIFWPGLSPAWQDFAFFMEGGMRTLQPTRGDASQQLFVCNG
jgi:hypothetical protein